MLDYTSREKKVLPVKIAKDKKLLLKPPKKALFGKLTTLQDELEKTEDVNDLYDRMLDASAEILSTNMSGERFTADEVDELFDLEDMALLINEYGKYAGQITKNPN